MTAVLAPRHRPGTVGAAMIGRAKLTPAGATVHEVRALFLDDHVHAALVVEAGVLLAVVDRSDLAGAPGEGHAAAIGRLDGRVVGADIALASARRVMLTSGRRRLAVVDGNGMLLGLLCLKRSRAGFCSDHDVVARSCG